MRIRLDEVERSLRSLRLATAVVPGGKWEGRRGSQTPGPDPRAVHFRSRVSKRGHSRACWLACLVFLSGTNGGGLGRGGASTSRCSARCRVSAASDGLPWRRLAGRIRRSSPACSSLAAPTAGCDSGVAEIPCCAAAAAALFARSLPPRAALRGAKGPRAPATAPVPGRRESHGQVLGGLVSTVGSPDLRSSLATSPPAPGAWDRSGAGRASPSFAAHATVGRRDFLEKDAMHVQGGGGGSGGARFGFICWSAWGRHPWPASSFHQARGQPGKVLRGKPLSGDAPFLPTLNTCRGGVNRKTRVLVASFPHLVALLLPILSATLQKQKGGVRREPQRDKLRQTHTHTLSLTHFCPINGTCGNRREFNPAAKTGPASYCHGTSKAWQGIAGPVWARLSCPSRPHTLSKVALSCCGPHGDPPRFATGLSRPCKGASRCMLLAKLTGQAVGVKLSTRVAGGGGGRQASLLRPAGGHDEEGPACYVDLAVALLLGRGGVKKGEVRPEWGKGSLKYLGLNPPGSRCPIISSSPDSSP